MISDLLAAVDVYLLNARRCKYALVVISISVGILILGTLIHRVGHKIYARDLRSLEVACPTHDGKVAISLHSLDIREGDIVLG